MIDRPISGHASASAINIASAVITKVILDTSFMLKNSSFGQCTCTDKRSCQTSKYVFECLTIGETMTFVDRNIPMR